MIRPWRSGEDSPEAEAAKEFMEAAEEDVAEAEQNLADAQAALDVADKKSELLYAIIVSGRVPEDSIFRRSVHSADKPAGNICSAIW